MYHFLNASAGNKLLASPTEKQESEIKLVVPARFLAATSDIQVAEILFREQTGKAERYTHFDFVNIKFDRKKYPLYL